MATIGKREAAQVEAANAGGKTPVVFIHGLWLLASSWDNWAGLFEEAGYAPVAVDWPDDPATIEEARANPDVFAKKTVGQVADHVAEVIGALNEKPAVMGHSTGGLLTHMIAGRGLPRGRPRHRPLPDGECEPVTEIVKIPNRGHSLAIDSDWREVAGKALGFVKRFT